MIEFKTIFDFILTNPYFRVLSFLIPVLSLIFAIIIYFKSKKIKKPCYAITSTNIFKELTSKIKSLSILYSEKKIANLTITKFVFWNAGKDIITSSDIAHLDPLRIYSAEECQILNAIVIYEKNKTNDFKVSLIPDQSIINISFEFLGKDDGAVIQIIHTGITNRDIIFSGTIKGAEKINQITPRVIQYRESMIWFITLLVPIIITSLFIGKFAGEPNGLEYLAIFLLFAISIVLGKIMSGVIASLVRYIPKEYESFGKEFLEY